MKKKLNNQGLTLIELVIAIAISTMILGAAFMFIGGAERAYHKAESGINLQMEGQILMEQIGNWVMESNRIVVSNDGTILFLFYIPLENDGSVIYPPGYTPNNEAKCRVLYSPRSGPDNKKSLYMLTADGIGDAENVIKEVLEKSGTAGLYDYFSGMETVENCISDYVTRFAASVPEGDDSDSLNSIIISLEMEQGKEGYRISDTFSMRNGLYNQFVTSDEDPAGGAGGDPAGGAGGAGGDPAGGDPAGGDPAGGAGGAGGDPTEGSSEGLDE